jgi:hypothetical protein
MALATASLIRIDSEQRRTLSDISGSTSKTPIRKLPPISFGRIPGRRKTCVTDAGYVRAGVGADLCVPFAPCRAR